MRRKLILPVTYGKKQAEAVADIYTIPPRLESILLAIYIILNLIMCLPGYDLFDGNQWYPEKKLQLARYIADRTGFLSTAQSPMLWVFAARNDPFMWITGWSFATFNRFHRWVARISVFHAVVHSIAYSIFALYEGSYRAYWNAEYWWCGAIAIVMMSLMLGASAYYFRAKFYDLFLMVHIAMSFVFLITLWYHVRIFNGEFNYYLYPCIAIWAFDRLLRVTRTVSISIMPRLVKGVKASATYNRATGMIRLDVTDFFPDQKLAPGLYYYVCFPNSLRGYESHPFTMCSWRRAETSLPCSPTTSIEDKELDFEDRLLLSPKHSDLESDDVNAGEIAHTFLIRPYKGMTRRLQQKLSPCRPRTHLH
ncbi:Putative ferric reductase transmembrane component-like domain-containing protein [Septoria linicola]|uniref:Ferric reductase transmembrane component-like domain-containing protein n=1 Tax=Septoria linicola TaxID=215465 RepID=A0A9Q9ANF4_9PEZI|nr:Putative ferric reductase transmembrane component-like domain-containing protein [Septoria linicola]